MSNGNLRINFKLDVDMWVSVNISDVRYALTLSPKLILGYLLGVGQKIEMMAPAWDVSDGDETMIITAINLVTSNLPVSVENLIFWAKMSVNTKRYGYGAMQSHYHDNLLEMLNGLNRKLSTNVSAPELELLPDTIISLIESDKSKSYISIMDVWLSLRYSK